MCVVGVIEKAILCSSAAKMRLKYKKQPGKRRREKRWTKRMKCGRKNGEADVMQWIVVDDDYGTRRFGGHLFVSGAHRIAACFIWFSFPGCFVISSFLFFELNSLGSISHTDLVICSFFIFNQISSCDIRVSLCAFTWAMGYILSHAYFAESMLLADPLKISNWNFHHQSERVNVQSWLNRPNFHMKFQIIRMVVHKNLQTNPNTRWKHLNFHLKAYIKCVCVTWTRYTTEKFMHSLNYTENVWKKMKNKPNQI